MESDDSDFFLFKQYSQSVRTIIRRIIHFYSILLDGKVAVVTHGKRTTTVSPVHQRRVIANINHLYAELGKKLKEEGLSEDLPFIANEINDILGLSV